MAEGNYDGSGAPGAGAGEWSNPGAEHIVHPGRFDALVKSAAAAVFMMSPGGEISCFPTRPEDSPWRSKFGPAERHISQFVHPADLPAVSATLESVSKGGQFPTGGLTLRVVGSESRWVNVRCSIDTSSADARNILCVARDVTDERRAWEELRAAISRSEDANGRLNRLSGQISAGLGAVDDLARKMAFLKESARGLDSRAMEALESAVWACAGLSKRLSDMLAEAGSGLAESKSIFMDASHLAEAVVQNLALQAGNMGVKIVSQIPPHTRVYAPASALQSALTSLAQEAAALSPSRSEVTLYAPAAMPGVIGVRAVGVQRLAEAEARISRVRPFAAACGGAVNVEMENGGLTFTITLPARRPLALVVDDDDNLLYLTGVHMEMIGAEVMSAANGRIAMELVEKRTPDLVITDYQMPEMDGLALLAALRERAATRETPVIVLTSLKDKRIKERIFALGADDFVLKPLTENELIPRARRFIG